MKIRYKLVQTQNIAAEPAPDFYVGQTNFPWGDSIEITSVERDEKQLTVKGHYQLVSADEASLSLNITPTNDTYSALWYMAGPVQPLHPAHTQHISKGLTNTLMTINYDSGVLIIGVEDNWASRKSGFDGLYPLRKNDAFSVASNPKLKGFANLGMNASPIYGENSWDEIPATAVVEQFSGPLANAQYEEGISFFPAKYNEPFPPIWLFLTHDESNMGMLQISGFTENPPGVKIRYKLVQNGATNPKNGLAASRPAALLPKQEQFSSP